MATSRCGQWAFGGQATSILLLRFNPLLRVKAYEGINNNSGADEVLIIIIFKPSNKLSLHLNHEKLLADEPFVFLFGVVFFNDHTTFSGMSLKNFNGEE